MRASEAGAKSKAKAEAAPAGDSSRGLEELKRLRQEQIEMLGRAAAAGDPTADRLAARVQNLSASIHAIEQARERPRKRRLDILIVAIAVIVPGTLLLRHRPSAEILVEAKASRVSFTAGETFAPLRGIAGIGAVELVGLARIQQEGVPEIAAGPNDDLALRLASDVASRKPGGIGFDALVIPAGTRVEITQNGNGKTIELHLQYPSGAKPTLDLDVSGDLTLHTQGQPQRKANFPTPDRITAVPAGDAELAVTFQSQEIVFPAPIRVQAISWSRDVRSASGYPGAPRAQSSLLSGKLSFEEFREKSVILRNGEPLDTGGASGLIRQLRSDGQALSCQFDGTVRDLSVGEGARKQSLMPTWLEWMRQRDALVQFWALAAYLTGLGLAISRWWGESK
jgi:hypothetical protein